MLDKIQRVIIISLLLYLVYWFFAESILLLLTSMRGLNFDDDIRPIVDKYSIIITATIYIVSKVYKVIKLFLAKSKEVGLEVKIPKKEQKMRDFLKHLERSLSMEKEKLVTRLLDELNINNTYYKGIVGYLGLIALVVNLIGGFLPLANEVSAILGVIFTYFVKNGNASRGKETKERFISEEKSKLDKLNERK